ncbi:quinone-dependent dihydroorotate dehydrogenase [Kouleothrix sp.]|uniref:quinone-dependent dihydroorotate dehydrogenase n=1 Tax=Kouleothrix sp. TaxID=2779161 RepID=UPI00391A56DC
MLYRTLKPLLFRLEAERAHNLVSGLLRAADTPALRALVAALAPADDALLACDVAGLRFANPVGLAAGFDKHATLIGPMAALGFGSVEVGTVTPRAQPGNPRPRLFRLPEDAALINRMGFNSPGMVAAAQNLRGYRQAQAPKSASGLLHIGARLSARGSLIIGVNIGKNRTTELERAAEDYLAAFVALAPLADYIAVNISSPNTPGLRKLHERAALEQLLGELNALNRRMARPRPVFLKVSPDEAPAQLSEVVAAGLAAGVDGFIATNTTLARAGLRSPQSGEAGGLSGRPLAAPARQVIEQIHRFSEGRAPIIGVGGVASAADAYAHIRAGASLVQLYTSLIYAGPGLVYQLKRELAALLRRDGFGSVAAAVGSAPTAYAR